MLLLLLLASLYPSHFVLVDGGVNWNETGIVQWLMCGQNGVRSERKAIKNLMHNLTLLVL